MSDFHDIKSLIEQSDERVFERIDAIQGQVKEVESELLTLQQKGAVGGLIPETKNRAPFKTLHESEGLRAFKSGARDSGQINLAMSVKTLTSLQGSTASPVEGIDVQSQRESGLYGYAMRPLTLLEALPVRSIGSNALTFTRMVSYSNAADTQAGEGQLLAEQTINPELVSAPVETLGVHHVTSFQVIDDEPGLEQSISMLLMHGVQKKAEEQIIGGAGGSFEMSGLLTEATPFVPSLDPPADRIGECAANMANTGYQPDLVILNPVDWFKIRGERAGSAEYVANGWTGPTSKTIYDLTVVSSPAVSAGTAIVVDTRFISLLDRMAPSVEFSRDSTDLKQGLVTMVCAARLGLAVFDSLAVQSIDLTAPIA